MGKTIQTSPLDDTILDIRVIYTFPKYKEEKEHIKDLLEHLNETPNMNFQHYEYKMRKNTGGVFEEIEPKKTLKDFREQLIEDWYNGQRREITN